MFSLSLHDALPISFAFCRCGDFHSGRLCMTIRSQKEIAERFVRRCTEKRISRDHCEAAWPDRFSRRAAPYSRRCNTKVPGLRCAASLRPAFHSDLLRQTEFAPGLARLACRETKLPSPQANVQTPREATAAAPRC